jgi:hypothetical protein
MCRAHFMILGIKNLAWPFLDSQVSLSLSAFPVPLQQNKKQKKGAKCNRTTYRTRAGPVPTRAETPAPAPNRADLPGPGPINRAWSRVMSKPGQKPGRHVGVPALAEAQAAPVAEVGTHAVRKRPERNGAGWCRRESRVTLVWLRLRAAWRRQLSWCRTRTRTNTNPNGTEAISVGRKEVGAHAVYKRSERDGVVWASAGPAWRLRLCELSLIPLELFGVGSFLVYCCSCSRGAPRSSGVALVSPRVTETRNQQAKIIGLPDYAALTEPIKPLGSYKNKNNNQAEIATQN